MKKIRVLQIIPSFAMGGAERFVVQLMHALDRASFDVTALSLYDRQGTELEKMLTEHQLPATFLNKHPGLDVRIFGQVCRAVHELRPHIVHTHLHALNYAVPAIAARFVPRAVHTVHSVAERERSRIGKWVPRILFSRRITPVAIASDVQKSIRRVYGVDSVLIPNGIPLAAYRNMPGRGAEWRRCEGFLPEDILFTCVGRLDPVKNHYGLIAAFARACEKAQNAHLLLAGNGSERDFLGALVQALGLQYRVHFLGIRSDIPALLGASDVFVFASDYEASPLSVLEAMAAGLPIIGTAVGGVPELVPERVGISVPPGNPTSLAEAITSLYVDVERRARMSAAAAERAFEFDILKTAGAYESLYTRLVEHRSVSDVDHPSLTNARKMRGEPV
jgi:glycosyltransferase involved in cell wall biosynthesis